MGVRRSLGSKAIEHSPAVIAVHNLDSPSRPYFNNHSQKVAVGSVERVSTFSQFLIQWEMLSQGTVPRAHRSCAPRRRRSLPLSIYIPFYD
jgi:hypothetical protein